MFVDEPAVSLRAQRRLIEANLHYLALAMRSAIWVAVPLGLLLIHLESFYERAPLPLARPAVVTMRMTADWAPSAPPPELVAPPNVAILGPPVRVAAAREVSWRILAVFAGFTEAAVSLQWPAGVEMDGGRGPAGICHGEAGAVGLGNDPLARREPHGCGIRRLD